MSTPPPPERPTQPLRAARPIEPAVPAPAAPLAGTASYVDPAYVDPDAPLLGLESALSSLRTWLAILSLIAVAALGIAVYAALRDRNTNENASRNGLASEQRVSDVNRRVDRLNNQVQALRARNGQASGASATDTAALSSRVDALDRSVKTLASRPASTGTSGNDTQALSQLSSRIDTLTSQVNQLKASQSSSPSSGSTP